MPSGSWTSSSTYTGPLFTTGGPPFNAPFDPNQVEMRQVGTATLTFSSVNNGTFGCWFHQGSEAATAGDGFTILGDQLEGTRRVTCEYKVGGDTTVDMTWAGGGAVIGMALEVKMGPGGALVNRPPLRSLVGGGVVPPPVVCTLTAPPAGPVWSAVSRACTV